MIIHGDCVAEMAKLDAESVDAIVCDPPYGIAFMGRSWDNAGVAFDPKTWEAALRVLRPGGHLLAFGGTRTYHRMTCAIEDAGFEIRDSIHWTYGCLSADTEILTEHGWERYRSDLTGVLICCYDSAQDTFSWQPASRVVWFPYSDTAVRLVGDHCDQLVTTDHRCIVERSGNWVVEAAWEVARQPSASVPVLEDVSQLLNDLPVPHERAGHPQPDVLQNVCERSDRSGQSWPDAPHCQSLADLPGVLGAVPALSNQEKEPSLLASMLGEVQGKAGCGQAAGNRGQWQVGVDGPVQILGTGQDDGVKQPCVEGRRNLLPQARELQADQVCAVSSRVPGDGSQGRLRYGASPDGGAGFRASPVKGRGGASSGPQPDEQRSRQPGVVQEQQGPQVVRASRYASAGMVRVSTVGYEGTMWCVTVPTGAFVARRNGEVFVTGNSGFPKSKNVSLAIDKGEGYPNRGRAIPTASKFQACDTSESHPLVSHRVEPYESKTATAEKWSGWGTALKPAQEPVCVARKPLVGTVAANVLAYGTGALNIDVSRIGWGAGGDKSSERKSAGYTDAAKKALGGVVASESATGFSGEVKGTDSSAGRWPANFILTHSAGCVEVGTRTVQGDNRGDLRGVRPGGFVGTGADIGDGVPCAPVYGDATVATYRCVADCPVSELDRQSEISTAPAVGSVVMKRSSATGGASRYFHQAAWDAELDTPGFFYCAKAGKKERNAGIAVCTCGRAPRPQVGADGQQPPPHVWCGDCGGLRSGHPTVKPVRLMQYLITLVTPPGGVVLDPFLGSGTTGVAAARLRVDFVGIEQDADYVEIARQRIDFASKQTPPEPQREAAAVASGDVQETLFDLT